MTDKYKDIQVIKAVSIHGKVYKTPTTIAKRIAKSIAYNLAYKLYIKKKAGWAIEEVHEKTGSTHVRTGPKYLPGIALMEQKAYRRVYPHIKWILRKI